MKVFISYSHIDSEIAGQIENILLSSGTDYFRDIKGIGWGSTIDREVRIALNDATHLLVIISPASHKSQWVSFEIGAALAQEKYVLPYLVHPSLDLPPFISGLSYLKSLGEVSRYFQTQLSSPETIISNISEGSVTNQSRLSDRFAHAIEKLHGPKNRRAFEVINSIYELKKIKRLGWNAREGNDIESVAEHSYMTTLLAQIFLPESSGLQGYDKSRVISLLILHDIGETATDSFSNNENGARDQSLRIIEYEEKLSFFAGGDVKNIDELNKEFESKSTINAHIAHDIDKLECLIQHHMYQKQSRNSDFDSFRLALKDGISTEMVSSIFQSIDQALQETNIPAIT
jgi:5'-deoxynucleotidase YfbR-like HD superfamily hydrolase